MVRSLRRAGQGRSLPGRSGRDRPFEERRGGSEHGQQGRRDDATVAVAGLAAVGAVFATRPERVEKLAFIDEMKADAAPYCLALAKAHRPYKIVNEQELARIAGTPMHGGIVAIATPPVIAEFDPLDAGKWAAAGEPLLILAGVGNPHNLGAIVRTAAFFGVPRVLLADLERQALPSGASIRVAKGGMEHVAFFRTERLIGALKRMPESYFVVAADVDGEDELPALQVPNDKAVALILGNEEDGLTDEVIEHCDAVVRIPGGGAVESLNVAASAAILINRLMG